MHEQLTTALLVGVDVPIDPCVTGQAGAAGNLFGTDVLPQQDLDLADALGVDAWTPACLRAPMGADALRVIGGTSDTAQRAGCDASSRLIVLGARQS